MPFDVLSVLQANTPSVSGEPMGSGDAASPSEAGGDAFASVFAQVMPPPVGGQDLAALSDSATPQEGLDGAPEAPDPSVAWLNWPGLNPAVDPSWALQTKSLGSGQMQLITPAQASPDTQGDGLMAFAQGQGLDEAALQRLFGPELAKSAPPVVSATVLPAAAWIAGGQRSMGVHTPVVDPDGPITELSMDRLVMERAALSLLPSKRIAELSSPKTNESLDPPVTVGEDGRVELDLDVGALLSELAPEADLKALKAEERAALSLRIGEMLAQRMVAQAQRGQWQLRFALNPQNLGRVEIDMQMRGGELEATLGAINPATRELLQEALPRLREMLQQSGMDVASLNIGSGGASKNGGQPTPSSANPGQSAGSVDGESTQPDATAQQQRRAGADGWDIWV